ncbi:hypothetical protein BDL97_02G183700 [Sphagnum fallax]|nr:hypothetical protein BDL97_02G183700 [Sphagnum fallax]
MKKLMPSLYGHGLHGIVPALVFELQNASCNFEICIRFSFAAVVGFALRVGKEGLEAGTKLVHGQGMHMIRN